MSRGLRGYHATVLAKRDAVPIEIAWLVLSQRDSMTLPVKMQPWPLLAPTALSTALPAENDCQTTELV